jgi:hypothetical protein
VVWNGDLDQAEKTSVTASVTPAPKPAVDPNASAPTTSIGSNKATN